MKTYYVRTRKLESAEVGNSVESTSIHQVEAENRVQAYIKIYKELQKQTKNITVEKHPISKSFLDFTDNEWKEILNKLNAIPNEDCRDECIQISVVSDYPLQ